MFINQVFGLFVIASSHRLCRTFYIDHAIRAQSSLCVLQLLTFHLCACLIGMIESCKSCEYKWADRKESNLCAPYPDYKQYNTGIMTGINKYKRMR